MGCWSIGVLEYCKTCIVRFLTTPLLHYSITPILQYSNTPILHSPITPIPNPSLSPVRACKSWANANTRAEHTTKTAKATPMHRSPAFGSRPDSCGPSSRRTRHARVLTALLCATLVPAAQATNHLLRMDEIMAALEGDPTIQFIEIVTSDNSQKDWGPQGAETESRAMLVFFDGAGNQTVVFKFPNRSEE